MQKKIIIIFVLNVIVTSIALSIISYPAVHDTVQRSLQDRIALARIISQNVEVFLNDNLKRLQDVSLSEKINPQDVTWEPEKRMLETVYRYSLFTEGVFLLDKHGNELLSYPPQVEYFSNLTHISYVNQVLEYGRPVISNVYTIEPIKKSVIFILTPLKDRQGRITGVVGGILGLTDSLIEKLLQSAKFEDNVYIEIIDSNEVVVAADKPSHLLQHHDHDSILSGMIRKGESGIVECKHGFSHSDSTQPTVDRLAFVPLNLAPWGVIVGQPEKDILAPAVGLQREFTLFLVVFALTSVVFSVGMSNNIAKPLRSLIVSTDKIASGDLSTPIGNVGSDEILKLSKSFDDMRKKLAKSLEWVKTQNMELESRVAERTQQIGESRQKVQHLLKKIISSQEDERRRVARDLHDTVLQDVLAFLIKLDVCKLRLDLVSVQQIDEMTEMREIAMKIVDNIHTVIKDLRPSILDDLGIVDATRWLLNKHLKENGINYYFDVDSPARRRFPPEIEITLFRIIQESIINIRRHAHAENVFVSVVTRESLIEISIEDDGDGFNVDELIRQPVESGKNLGIIGMKERASLLDGKLQIHSRPGEGTRVCVQVPLKTAVGHVVMLVDDEEAFVNPLAQRLRLRDLIVDTEYSGEQALLSLSEKKPAVVVLDLEMPGLHGMDVLRSVKKAYPDMKVIILTGHGSPEDEEEARKLGGFAFLRKPPDIDVLIAKIKEGAEHV